MKKLSFLLTILYTVSLILPFAVQAQVPGNTNPGDTIGGGIGGGTSLVGVQVDYSKLYDFAKKKSIVAYGTIHTAHPEWLCNTAVSGTRLLCGPATASFNAMNAAFKAAKGHNIVMSGGYRTSDEQIKNGGTLSNPKGGSFAPYDPNKEPPEHGWGTAIDLSPGDAESVAWVKANGKKFGWFRPTWANDGYEWWHFQYYSTHHKGGTPLDADEKKGGIGPDGQGGGGGSSTATATFCTKVGNPPGPTPTECGSSDPSINCKGAECAFKYIVNPYDKPGPNQDYGPRDGGFHNGIDLAGPVNTPIHAVEAGIATQVRGGCANVRSSCGGGAGNYVFMKGTSGRIYKYMHMSKSPNVAVNKPITRGQVLGPRGTSGDSSGPHLHFQIEKGGVVNPVTELRDWPWTQ